MHIYHLCHRPLWAYVEPAVGICYCDEYTLLLALPSMIQWGPALKKYYVKKGKLRL